MTWFLEEAEDMQRYIEHEKDTIRVMKRLILSRPDGSPAAEIAQQVINDAKNCIRDFEARLEEMRRKHFHWLREREDSLGSAS